MSMQSTVMGSMDLMGLVPSPPTKKQLQSLVTDREAEPKSKGDSSPYPGPSYHTSVLRHYPLKRILAN